MANTIRRSSKQVHSKSTTKKLNPFDLKHQRPLKHAVLNSNNNIKSHSHKHNNSSSIVGRPSLSKSHAIELRKNTLLKELKEEGKTNKFIDKRIKHRKDSSNINTEMSKMQRFLMAKQQSNRAKKAQKYNDILRDDNDEHNITLTHRGKELTNDSDFESEPEDYDLLVDDRYEQGENFGNFLNDDEGVNNNNNRQKKSKAEVMQEIIAKSKMHKLKRQQQREENEALCDVVNQDFDQLRDEIVKTQGLLSEQKTEGQGMGTYETLMRELQFDKKVKPGDKRKTEKEIEDDKIAKERAKQARMIGTEEHSASNSGNTNDVLGRLDKEMRSLLNEYLNSMNKDNAQSKYKTLKNKLGEGQNIIALARAIRAEIDNALLTSLNHVNVKRLVLMLQLVNRIFSTSDAHHLVVTPCNLLACKYLMDFVLSSHDVATSRLGLAITWILIDYQKDSKRWLPEVANYLGFILNNGNNKASRSMILGKDVASPISIHKQSGSDWNDKTSAITLQSLIFEEPDVLVSARTLVHRFISLYNPRPKNSFVDESLIIKSAGSVHITPTDRLSVLPEILNYFSEIDGKLKLPIMTFRDKMRMLNHAPMSLPSLNPELEDSYLPGRLRSDNTRYSNHKSKNEEMRETMSLKRALKKETKGARRELQRDTQFLARERALERKAQDIEYDKRIKRIYGGIANDAAGIKDKKRRKY